MAEVLLEELGPNGNVQAVVESDDDVCFFYLFGASETGFEMKSVWVRNHKRAPASLDVERMRAGSPPCNPAQHCRHPGGQPHLEQNQLHVVWLPEGNGAALCEGDEILSIIPPWSGTGSFHGYTRDCVGQSPVAWELQADNVLLQRFANAQSYWQGWDDENLWPSIQSSLLKPIETTFGPHSNYYAIDGGNWPPKAMIRIPQADKTVLVTLGVSVRPQPNVELETDEPELLRRIELGVVLPTQWPERALMDFGKYMSGQSNLPWNRYTWFGPGHTIPCDAWRNKEFSFALFARDHAAVASLSLGRQFGDPVNVLWFVPITANEREIAINDGSDRLLSLLPPTRWFEA